MTFLIAIGGHTGTGKTTLAYAMKQCFGTLADALIVEDDQMRREVLARTLREKLSPEDYADEISHKVRARLDEEVRAALTAGRNVIDSSGFYKSEGRRHIERLAGESGASFVGFWLVASRATMEERIRKRLAEREGNEELAAEKGHASDACLGVIDKLGDSGFSAAKDWIVIDADGSIEEILLKVGERIGA